MDLFFVCSLLITWMYWASPPSHFLCNVSGWFCPHLRITLMLMWFILGPKFKCSFLYTIIIWDSGSLIILGFTIKCSIRLHSLNLHLCNIKKLTFCTFKIFYNIILLYLYKYLICSCKPLMFVVLIFSQFIYHILKVKLIKFFNKECIHASVEHFFLTWQCDNNLPLEELRTKVSSNFCEAYSN